MATATPTIAAVSQVISRPPHCTAYNLPANGTLVFDATHTITLTANAVFQPECTDVATLDPNGTLPISDFKDPFVVSTIPQIFVLGAMLFLAWVLVFILIITPRTFFIVGSNGGGILGRRGFMGGATGTTSVIGVGGRPWLQKAATLGVGVSLLIATINSFKFAGRQYNAGYEDATELTNGVVQSLELRIIRIISFTFLWLAQVQTLIRLFPRHKEKVNIKWAGFALIFLDTLFAILNNFLKQPTIARLPDAFSDAIPALAYILQLFLNFTYLVCVMTYSYMKRRFAYYHPKMRNISIVAFISVCSICVPLVFFVLDVAESGLFGWGDYVRWVGAAAASVVVWEWVERVEALEREERKDGILGREIFDSDEAPSSSSTIEVKWPRRRQRNKIDTNSSGTTLGGGDESPGSRGSETTKSSGRTLVFARQASRLFNGFKAKNRQSEDVPGGEIASIPTTILHTKDVPETLSTKGGSIEPPQAVASPISRADTTSAASTVYAVIRHAISDAQSPALDASSQPPRPNTIITSLPPSNIANAYYPPDPVSPKFSPLAPSAIHHNPFSRSSLPFQIRRHRTAPPPEVRAALSAASSFAASPRPRKRDRLRRRQQMPQTELPLMFIPAREDGGAWSPPGEDGDTDDGEVEAGTSRGNSARAGSVQPSSGPGTTPSPANLPSIAGTLERATSPRPPSEGDASQR